MGADLRGADMRGTRLVGASLRASYLQDAQLQEAQFSDTDLRGAYLQGASLEKATLPGARLQGADLEGTILRCADLSDADLQGVKMRGADLREVCLSGARLWNVDLHDADLRGADLRRADLRHARLDGARLTGAVLREADLHGASLEGADLSEVDLRDADLRDVRLSGARMGLTILGNVDFSGTHGLASVAHLAPSTLGIDTLFRSRGALAREFLRGVGVPEDFVGMFGQTDVHTPCVISHSAADRLFARKLHDHLQERGARCWLAEHTVDAEQPLPELMEANVRLRDRILLVCSRAALESWWIDPVMESVFQQERLRSRERGAKVVTLVTLELDGFLKAGHWQNPKERELRARRVADFDGWEGNAELFQNALREVLETLRPES